jgi:hypothetical protein
MIFCLAAILASDSGPQAARICCLTPRA